MSTCRQFVAPFSSKFAQSMSHLSAYFRSKGRCENLRGVPGRTDGKLTPRRCENPASWEEGVFTASGAWWCAECYVTAKNRRRKK